MKKLKLVCCISCLFLLTGCFDSRDVKNVAIVMGIGVDEGDGNRFDTITQVIVPGGLGKDGDGDTYENYSGEGEHLGECMENTALKCGKFMYLSHATALLISEGTAKNGIYEIIDYFMRDNQLRSNLLIAVARGNVEEIMKNESDLVKVPLSGIASLDRRFGETSLGQAPTVFGFVSDMLKKDCATLVPVVESAGGEMTVVSSAVFKNGKMIGEISNREARGALWLLDKIENAIMTINYDGNTFDIKISKANTKIKPLYNIEETVFDVNISCTVSLLRDDKGVVNAYGTKKVREKISESIINEIKNTCKKLKEMNADVCGMTNIIYLQSPDTWEKLKKKNSDFFKNTKENIFVECKMEEVGNILRSAEKYRGGE